MPKDEPMSGGSAHQGHKARQRSPDWAFGLRRLYDSVVEEPLPESFEQLLNKLDEGGNG